MMSMKKSQFLSQHYGLSQSELTTLSRVCGPDLVPSSLWASLYQPYLDLPEDHPALVKANVDPLRLMKEGAHEVAKSVRSVMAEKKSDTLPTWL